MATTAATRDRWYPDEDHPGGYAAAEEALRARASAAVRREYGAHDMAGCVCRRRVRASGGPAEVALFAAVQAGLDPAGGPWATACLTHGAICNHATLALARAHLGTAGWCEACQSPPSGGGATD